MVSDFLTPGGRLAVPDAVSDAELAARLLPGRHATEHFVYGKNKYWWGDDISCNSDLQRYISWLSSWVHPTIALMQLMRSELRT